MYRADHVHTVRATLAGILRFVALGLIGYGSFLILARLSHALVGNGNVSSAVNVWQGIGENHGVFRSLPMLLIGGTLALMAERLARWTIRPPEVGCPRCGYEADPGSTVCQECGVPVQA